MKRLVLLIIIAGALLAPAASQAAMPRYHTCRPVYRRYDESLLAKPGVPCWLARAVEVKQPHGGHWFDGYRWSEDAAQDRRLRWHDGFWRRRVDGSWPAVVVIHIPSN